MKFFKVGLFPSKTIFFICFDESPLKMMKNIMVEAINLPLKEQEKLHGFKGLTRDSLFQYRA